MATFTIAKYVSGVTVQATITYSVSSTSTQTTLTVSKVAIKQTHTASAIAGITGVSLGGAVTWAKTYSSVTGSDRTETPNKTATWSRSTSDQSKTLTATLNFVLNGQDSATGSATITVPVLASYAVTYNANGGSGTTSAQTKYYGQALALRSNGFTRTNYVFKNWNTKQDGSGTSYSAGASYTGNAALKLYAQWYAPYTVSYDANGGTGAPASQTKVHGTALTLSSTKPTRTGYVFKRWNTSTGDTGTAYNPGASYTANAAAKLYAIWNPVIYYNANGGTDAPSSQTKTYGTALTLSSTRPTRTGYTFSKWNTAKAGTGTNYNPGASYTSNATATLYAQWTANTYTVSFNANGGVNPPSSQTKTYDTALTLPTTKPTRIGHTFLGWSTSSTATTATWAAGGTFSNNITAATTLYAVWRSNYTAPKITSLTAVRCDSGGTADDEGTYVKVTAKWSTMQSIDQGKTSNYGTVTGKAVAVDGSQTVSFTLSPSGSGVYGGTSTAIVDLTAASTERSHIVTVTVTDHQGGKSTARSTVLSSAMFVLDFKAGGEGMGIGAAAPSTGLAVGYDVDFLAQVKAGGTRCYPCFVTSAIASYTPPVSPCLVLDTSDYGLYWWTA